METRQTRSAGAAAAAIAEAALDVMSKSDVGHLWPF